MTSFNTILEAAEKLQGSADLVQARMSVPKTKRQLRAIADSEYLSLMSRRIFRAGLKHSMVDGKWPAFEQVFAGFDIDTVRMLSDEDLEALMQDKRIIRHWGKIKSVRANAAAIHELQEQHGSMGKFIADWPGPDIIGLWDELKQRFSQLGGNSGPYFLRMAGKDTFLFTRDVVRALNHWGAISGEPKNKTSRVLAQDAFNQWMEQSGLPLCQISMVLALSTR